MAQMVWWKWVKNIAFQSVDRGCLVLKMWKPSRVISMTAWGEDAMMMTCPQRCTQMRWQMGKLNMNMARMVQASYVPCLHGSAFHLLTVLWSPVIHRNFDVFFTVQHPRYLPPMLQFWKPLRYVPHLQMWWQCDWKGPREQRSFSLFLGCRLCDKAWHLQRGQWPRQRAVCFSETRFRGTGNSDQSVWLLRSGVWQVRALRGAVSSVETGKRWSSDQLEAIKMP